MFSGIVACTGTLESVMDQGTTKLLSIRSPLSDSFHVDQSIAHNGVCLTVIKSGNGMHQVEAVNETLSKTNLGRLHAGDEINIEKSITMETLLDGHLVQGHVDMTLICQKISNVNGSWMFQFNLPAGFEGLVIPHGSICINGVSLTIANLHDTFFDVAIIPYTYEHTNFKNLNEGDLVNVEFDLIGKYLIRQLELRKWIE
jgi:riboflavin synthase